VKISSFDSRRGSRAFPTVVNDELLRQKIDEALSENFENLRESMKKNLKVEIKEGFKKDFESETQKLQEEINQVKE
jgi:hypothetical protein